MSSTSRTFTKAPDATLDYTLNWAQWLDSDTISSVTWVIPSGLTQAAASNTTTTATVWLSGGTVDTDYTITCRISTDGGRTDERSIRLRVRTR